MCGNVGGEREKRGGKDGVWGLGVLKRVTLELERQRWAMLDICENLGGKVLWTLIISFYFLIKIRISSLWSFPRWGCKVPWMYRDSPEVISIMPDLSPKLQKKAAFLRSEHRKASESHSVCPSYWPRVASHVFLCTLCL